MIFDGDGAIPINDTLNKPKVTFCGFNNYEHNHPAGHSNCFLKKNNHCVHGYEPLDCPAAICGYRLTIKQVEVLNKKCAELNKLKKENARLQEVYELSNAQLLQSFEVISNMGKRYENLTRERDELFEDFKTLTSSWNKLKELFNEYLNKGKS